MTDSSLAIAESLMALSSQPADIPKSMISSKRIERFLGEDCSPVGVEELFSLQRFRINSESSCSESDMVDKVMYYDHGFMEEDSYSMYSHATTTEIKYIGSYSPDARKKRIEKFLEKRKRRVWTKKVDYGVRKNFADSRLRVKGRFVKKEDEETLCQMLSYT